MTATPRSLARARAELARNGLMLEQDRERPSLVSLIAGAPVTGSWWGHAKGQEIFAVLTALSDDPDVVIAKLIDGKVTLIAKALWPAVVAVATANEPWQLAGLSQTARTLLEQVRAEGPLSTDQLARDTPGRRKLAAAARELEQRLLVRSEQVHTEHGAHARVLDTWERWAEARKLTRKLPALEDAKAQLEQATRDLGAEPHTLPWRPTDPRTPDSGLRTSVSASPKAGLPSKARGRAGSGTRRPAAAAARRSRA